MAIERGRRFWAKTGCLAAACLLAAVGCQPKTKDAASSRTTGAAAETPASEGRMTLEVARWADVEKSIAGHAGKVVVVDFWSTWCSPCVREFPGLVKLQQAYGDQVVCISVNLNYTGAADEKPDDARADVEKFLQEQRAAFANYLASDPDVELLEKLGAAAVPVVRVYDRQGKLQKQFTNDGGEYGEEGFEYAKHVEPLVKSLLGGAAEVKSSGDGGAAAGATKAPAQGWTKAKPPAVAKNDSPAKAKPADRSPAAKSKPDGAKSRVQVPTKNRGAAKSDSSNSSKTSPSADSILEDCDGVIIECCDDPCHVRRCLFGRRYSNRRA